VFGLNVRSFGAWLYVPRYVTLVFTKATGAKIGIVRDYMRDIDRTLLRENLNLTFEQRAQKHLRALQMVEELRLAGKKLRQKSDGR
jgi:hypothetical protein